MKSEKGKINAIEICRKNSGIAKQISVVDKAAWRQEGIDLVTRHRWIKDKKDELIEIFGPLAGVTIRDGKKTWTWLST